MARAGQGREGQAAHAHMFPLSSSSAPALSSHSIFRAEEMIASCFGEHVTALVCGGDWGVACSQSATKEPEIGWAQGWKAYTRGPGHCG